MAGENEDVKNKAVKEDVEDGASRNNETPQEVPSETELSLEERFASMEKEYLYLRAELENVKRQNFKERSQLLKYGAERLARDLLETLDVFRTAFLSEISADNFQDFVKGVEMTSQSLKNTLEKHGIIEMECVGQPFDPNTQEALSSEPSDQYPEGYVTQVFKAPYKYHDKLLRPGQVIVSRPKSE